MAQRHPAYGDVAQLGEHLSGRQKVVGSTPIVSTTEGTAERSATGFESRGGVTPGGSIPLPSAWSCGSVWSDRLVVSQEIEGSNPFRTAAELRSGYLASLIS